MWRRTIGSLSLISNPREYNIGGNADEMEALNDKETLNTKICKEYRLLRESGLDRWHEHEL